MKPAVTSRRRRVPLWMKIVAWTFIPTAIILLMVSLLTYQAYQQATQEVVTRQDEELTRLSATELSAGFGEYIDRLTALARLPDVYQGYLSPTTAALQSYKNNLIFFDTGIYVLNNLGIVLTSLPENPKLRGEDWSDKPYFQKMIQSPAPVFSDIAPDGPKGEDVIVLAVPILDPQEKFNGVVVGMFHLDATAVSPFYGSIIKLHLWRSGTADIVDGHQRIIYSSSFSQIGASYAEPSVVQHAFSGQAGSLRTRTQDGSDVVVGYAPVPDTSWTLIVQEDWNALLVPSIGPGRFLWVLLILGLLIPIGVVTLGLRRITGPITAFTQAAQRIAGGDFRQNIQVETGDELEELAYQFNTMALRLEESYETLEMRVEQRTQELTALNSIAAIVSRSLDLKQILPDALQKMIEVMGMEGGALLRLEENQEYLDLMVAQGLEDQFLNIIRRYSIHSSVIRRVLEDRQPVAELVSAYPPSELRSSLEAAGWKTVISIPLLAQEKVLGAINVVSRREIHPSPEMLAVPSAIGQQIGVAMDNARLFDQTLDYAHQMETARAAADRANAAKTDFLANVSHELRTPLVSILGFARIVQKRLRERILPLLPGEGKAHQAAAQMEDNLEIILTEGQRLTSMINNLLDLEKIEAGKMVWKSQPVAMDAVITQAATATSSLFEGQPIRLEREIPDGLPMVVGDPEKLLQVMINLISNAVKFTQVGSVRVHAQHVDGRLVVSVSDTGVGIAPQDQALVFNKFTQIGDSLTSKPKGTGLGLSISKEIVEHHGGQIWVESVPGQGSTFSFSLPVVDPAPSNFTDAGESAPSELVGHEKRGEI